MKSRRIATLFHEDALVTRILRGTTALLVTLLAATCLLAQERTGGIQGTVSDPSGAALPGANVEISGGSLIRPVGVKTNGAGGYSLPSLPPGQYQVSVTANGFASVKRNNVDVQVARVAVVDIKMEVGSVSETVVVEAAGAVVDTTTNIVATNVSADTYDRLPKGRSFDALVFLAPGVRNEPKGGGYQADGASGSENVYALDGVEVTNIQSGVLDRQTQIPIEWVSETTVKNSGVDAQYSSAVGGVVAANTKSGSDSFHGQVALYYKSDAFLPVQNRNALRLSPSDDLQAEYFNYKKDGYRYLNPGYALGGPIVKQKIWFFSSYFPIFERTNRNVKFNSGQTGSYERNDRQDYWLNRVDIMPFQKLRVNGSYQYNPWKANGLLPTQQGTDAFSNPWADRGFRQPYTSYNWQADYTATSRLVISGFGGYSYKNNKDYGVPGGTFYNFSAPSIGLAGVPAQFQAASGAFTPNNQQTTQDIFERTNANITASYLVSFLGQHSLKGGWQLNRLVNSPRASAFPDGRIYIYWNRSYNAVTIPNPPGGIRGTYGYYASRPFVTQGDVKSNNQGMFFNDSWRVNRKLTLNLGLRADKEYVPSFSARADVPSTAIEFNFQDKIAPRLGFAFDPSGVGKMKIFGSWGWYYDVMKYELPRGSFGGDYWVDTYYTLDDPNIFNIKPAAGDPYSLTGTFPGKKIESVDRRIPSNDPGDNLIEKNLKPMRQTAIDFGYEYSLTDKSVVTARYTHKNLDRAIEDVGLLTNLGEQYFIANPGYGITIDPTVIPAGYPSNVTPKAKRTYDALELRFERRYSKNLYLNASYTWSRLYGNYAGLASSDENGRTSPNVDRNFDLPWGAYDAKGQKVYGRLGTDRPHTFKLFSSYNLKSKVGYTTFAPAFVAYSGTPISTEVSVLGVPMLVNGRGDLGRTPIYSQLDFLVQHDFRGFREGQKFRIEFNATNILNQNTVTNVFPGYVQPNQGGGNLDFDDPTTIFKGFNYINLMQQQDLFVDPRYRQASSFQAPRDIRIGFHFFF